VSWSSAHSRLIGSLALGAGFGDVVVGLAERAARTTACQPRVDTAGVEGMATSQSSYIVVVLQSVQTDGACVAWLGQHFRRSSGADRVVLVVRLVLVTVNRGDVLARRVDSINLRHGCLFVLAILGGAAVGGRLSPSSRRHAGSWRSYLRLC